MKIDSIKPILIKDLIDIRYLTGFTGSNAKVLLLNDEKYLITDGRYTIQANQEAKTSKVVINTNYVQAIKEIVGEQEICVARDFTIEELDVLKEKLNVNTKDENYKKIKLMRQIKSNRELLIMKEANRIVLEVYKKIKPEIKAGLTEIELKNMIEAECFKMGAQKMSFDTIVAAGPNSALCHATPTNYVIKSEDVVLTDFGVIYEGYASDITRTIKLGKQDETFQERYNAVLRAKVEAEKALRVGVTGQEVHNVALGVLKEAGMDEKFVHSLGHSLGLEVHEDPRLSPTDKSIIKPGMMFTIEPGVYFEGEYGIRLEDDYVVQENTAIKIENYEEQ